MGWGLVVCSLEGIFPGGDQPKPLAATTTTMVHEFGWMLTDLHGSLGGEGSGGLFGRSFFPGDNEISRSDAAAPREPFAFVASVA